MKFGGYCLIEQKRRGVPNEFYQYKVIEALQSNTWVEVPVKRPETETSHDKIIPVLKCVCDQTRQKKNHNFRAVDCKPIESNTIINNDNEDFKYTPKSLASEYSSIQAIFLHDFVVNLKRLCKIGEDYISHIQAIKVELSDETIDFVEKLYKEIKGI